jgi:hypothetical protein
METQFWKSILFSASPVAEKPFFSSGSEFFQNGSGVVQKKARPFFSKKPENPFFKSDNYPSSVSSSERRTGVLQNKIPGKNSKPSNALPDPLKSGIESLSGISMEGVKVYFNSSQPAQLHASAYAQGNEIHIAPGEERHLPHEAWHIVQQAQGRVKPSFQTKNGISLNDDAVLEKEADIMGAKALQNNMINEPSYGLTSAHSPFSIVQRVPRKTDVGHAASIANGHSKGHKPGYLSDEDWETRIRNTIQNGEQKVLANDRTAYYQPNGWTVVVDPNNADKGTAVKTKNKNWFENLN